MMSESVTPVGIFWDIENIRIPRGGNPLNVIEALRERFCDSHHVELEFQVVCDIRKESPSIIQILNSLQITVVHIDAVSKNAADDKLRQLIRRFGDVHGPNSKIVAITGDINFATDLADLKRRKKVHIILLHNRQASEALLVSASEHYLFEDVVRHASGSVSEEKDTSCLPHEFSMYNIPVHAPYKQVITRLNRLGSNTGCKVESVHRGIAVLKFANRISAERARRRMDSSDVCGSKISTGKVRPSPLPKTSPEEFSREPSCEKQCTLPQISLTSHLEVFNLLPEDSNSPLLTPKGFVMPSGSSSPYVQKMGPFPPPPNPVEVGVPAMMSSTHPHHSQVKSTTSLGSSPENDPWMVSKILKDTPPPTLRTPDRSIRSVKEKNTESFEQYGYAFWNQTPEGYRRIRKAENDEGEVSQLTEGGAQPTLEPPFYSGIPPLLGFPPPTRFVAPPPSTVSVSSSEALDRTFRISPEATIDLHITNLDQSIQPNEMKRLLAMTFSQQVEVMQVLIHYLADGSYTACIRVPTQQAAQIAISNFQRKKLGKKRIMISYFNNQGKPSALLRSEVKSLLAEVPSCRLPLFRFREVFERRYNTSISVSDLYRMRDIVNITDDNGSGRMISLTRESRMSPSSAEGAGEGSFSAAVCSEHYKVPKRGAGGWAEREAKFDLPNVIIGLKEFEPKIKSLIESHNGRLYLNSLPDCYKDAFGPLPVVDDSQGVPLEHLVTRIRGVRLVRTPTTGVKHLEIVEIPENEDTFGRKFALTFQKGMVI